MSLSWVKSCPLGVGASAGSALLWISGAAELAVYGFVAVFVAAPTHQTVAGLATPRRSENPVRSVLRVGVAFWAGASIGLAIGAVEVGTGAQRAFAFTVDVLAWSLTLAAIFTAVIAALTGRQRAARGSRLCSASIGGEGDRAVAAEVPTGVGVAQPARRPSPQAGRPSSRSQQRAEQPLEVARVRGIEARDRTQQDARNGRRAPARPARGRPARATRAHGARPRDRTPAGQTSLFEAIDHAHGARMRDAHRPGQHVHRTGHPPTREARPARPGCRPPSPSPPRSPRGIPSLSVRAIAPRRFATGE